MSESVGTLNGVSSPSFISPKKPKIHKKRSIEQKCVLTSRLKLIKPVRNINA